jgi:5-methylcytosine-specific restriction protein B
MSSSISNPIWQEFLETWPIERLRTMTLSEYTSAGSKDCFVFWLESRLDKLGSIWGGSAFKFGIYSRNATTVEEGDTGRAYDANYGWYRKFGETSAEAFEAVRAQVVRVAEAARAGRLEEIDDVPLGNTYKWKIAFHYQNTDAPAIVCIFQRKPLMVALDIPLTDRQTPLSVLYRQVGAQRPPAESIVAFSKRLWTSAALISPYELRLPESALRKGTLPFSLGSAPFPATMHGGAAESQAAQAARFCTDTGLTFESDVRSMGDGKGMLRRRLGDYYAQIGASTKTVLVISPQPDGSFFIGRKGSSPPTVNALVVPKAAVLPNVNRTPVTPPLRPESSAPLNQILFGPPGTGKTYHAIDKALEILDPAFLREHARDRAALKARFDALAAAGQVQFVTFHQSFSYEDFVEGLRAESDEESGALRYEVADGVFKRLCESARLRVERKAPAPIDVVGRRIWKLSLGNATTERHVYSECIEKGYALLGYGAGADFAGCKTRDDIVDVLKRAGQDHESTDFAVTAANAFVLQVKPGDLVVVSEGNLKFRAIGEVTGHYRRLVRDDGDHYVQCRDVRWLRVYSTALPFEQLMDVRFSQATIYELRDGSINRSKLQALLPPGEPIAEGEVPRVLIIDEINRGNVSRIFGELITLIEPSKRAGAAESLEVVLPYSKQKFSVPGNVHLIGTMNTADRSLAGVDIALRRRFQFVEMPPRPDFLGSVTIAGVNLGELLTVMNQRIEALLDREHQLGHAYFMDLASSESIGALASVFRHQILPLLQEYFFEDWQRIAWVLNDHRKPMGCRFVVQQSTSRAEMFGGGVDGETEATLWRLEATAFGNAASYRGIVAAGDA